MNKIRKSLCVLGLLVGAGSLIFFRIADTRELEISTSNGYGGKDSAEPKITDPNRIDYLGDKEMGLGGRGQMEEDDVSPRLIARLPLSEIPGGSLVEARVDIMDAVVGAEGLGEIFTAENVSDEKRAERLARVALNAGEEPEVRQEALDQWLKLLPEESEALLIALSKDARLSPAMGAILIKDTLTRGVVVQAEVNYTLLKQGNNELRQLAAEQLALLTGKNHGVDLSAWSNEIRIFFGAQPKTP